MRRATIGTVLAAVACVAGAGLAQPAPDLFDEAGYRIARYRSPVRSDPAPATELAMPDALALVPSKDALFIDVMPVEGGVRDAVTGVWALSAEHLTIPGATWHPETGRAPVDEVLWQALEAEVVATRKAAPDRPIILFCRTDCWMSWNAARRLASRGIDNVWWLAEGTDGWHGAGRELVVARPVAVPAERQQSDMEE